MTRRERAEIWSLLLDDFERRCRSPQGDVAQLWQAIAESARAAFADRAATRIFDFGISHVRVWAGGVSVYFRCAQPKDPDHRLACWADWNPLTGQLGIVHWDGVTWMETNRP